MNQKIFVPFVLLPAYVLTVVTAIRTPLQIMAPEHGMTRVISSVALMFAMFVLWPILLQKKGLRYGEFLRVLLTMTFLVRLPVAAAYGMAFAFRWTEPSGEPVRFIRDFGPDMTTLPVVLIAQFVPLIMGAVVGTLVWTIAWAVAFRGKRSWSGTAITA